MNFSCCWTNDSIDLSECPYIAEDEGDLLDSLKKRVVEKCVDCFRFRDDLQRLREEGNPLAAVVPYIIEEYHDQKSQLQAMAGFLDSKRREIRFLHEVSMVLQTSMDLDEVLSVAMTAITAGKGFGMNRAFLLLADKEKRTLQGYLGVGPRNYEEAGRTWEDINRKNFSLTQMARNFYDTRQSEKNKFRDILEKLSVPLDDRESILNRALADRKPILIEQPAGGNDSGLASVLGVQSFVIMPLISRTSRVGVIIADNCVTQKPITPQDMRSMETFAFAVAFAIERASLHEQLQEKVDKLTVANAKLQEQQELLLRMEKMALVGKITSGIAHSIRNPLMVIGGFARSLLKNITADDPKREQLESIVREARQLDDVLDEALAYSDSLYPAVDMWDVNHLVTRVYQEMTERLEKGHVAGSLDLAADLPTAFIDYQQVSFCVRSIIMSLVEKTREGGALRVSTAPAPKKIELKIEGGPLVGAEHAEACGGLGLSLCSSILTKQEIPFRVESGDDYGTRYIIRLPIDRRDRHAETAGS